MDRQERMDVLVLFMALVAIGYIVLYFSGRHYLREEGFQNSEQAEDAEPRPPRRAPKVEMPEQILAPYTTQPIQNVDDYELSAVYQNESDREISTDLRNRLMSQYPLDWAGLPPSSSQFQAGLRETFVDAPPSEPVGANPLLSEMEGESMQPPDTQSLEVEERKLLQTYVPRNVGDKTTYDIDDARELIDKIYESKGLIPEVIHEDGSQVYEIVGVRKKDEKIVYEDEQAVARDDANAAAGEGVIRVVPGSIATVGSGADPYFDDSRPSRRDRWDYTRWTPGLERMFAPTYPKQEWY
jgi:hypothetical protein